MRHIDALNNVKKLPHTKLKENNFCPWKNEQ